MELAGLKVIMESDFTQVYSDLAQVNSVLQGFANNIKNAFNGIPDIGKRFNFTSNGASQAAQDAREYARAAREQAAADLDATKAARIKRQEDEKVNKKKDIDEYGQLVAANQALVREYYNAAAALIKYGDASGITAVKLEELKKKAKDGQDQLNKIEQGAGRYQRQVGNYAVGTAALAQQVKQITTEIPNFFISARIGFQSLSNNLPGIFNELTRIREANQALAASGQPTVSVFKQFLGVFSPLNLVLGIGVGLLSAYGPKLVELAKNLAMGGDAAQAAARAQKEYEEATKKATEEATKASHQERVNADLLYAATQNVALSYNDRHVAAKQLIELAPKIFKGLNEEAIIAGRAANAYHQLADAIKQKIAVAVGEEQATQLFKEVERTQKILNDQKELVGVTNQLNTLKAKQYDLAVKTQGVMTKERREMSSQIGQLERRQRELSGAGAIFNPGDLLPNKQKQEQAINESIQALARYEKKIQDVSAIKGKVDALFDKPDKAKGISGSVADVASDLEKQNRIIDAQVQLGVVKFTDGIKQKIDNYQSYIKKLTTSKLDVSVDDPKVQNAIQSIESLNNELSKLSNFDKIDTAFLNDKLQSKGESYKKLAVDIARVGPAAKISFEQYQKAVKDGLNTQRLAEFYNELSRLLENVKERMADVAGQTASLIGQTFDELTKGDFKNLFKGLVTILGEQLSAFGKDLIKIALTMQTAQKAIRSLASNPVLAGIAGGALVVLGELLKTQANKSAKQVGKVPFAAGGVVYGPTNALVGEYAGARGNPEVIAPLDKLKTILKQQDTGNRQPSVVVLDTVLRGQDLLLTVRRAEKSENR